MAEVVTAPEFAGVVGGGSAGGGQYVYFVIRLGDKDVPMMIEKSRVGEMMLGLATAAALARKDRVRVNPEEMTGTGNDAAYALVVSGMAVGRSSQPGHAILDVFVDTDAGPMNLYLAAPAHALERIVSAATRGLALLREPLKKVARH